MSRDEVIQLIDRLLMALSLGLGVAGLAFQDVALMRVGVGLLAAVGVLRLDNWLDLFHRRIRNRP